MLSPVKIWSTLHAIFGSFTNILHKIPVLVEFPAPGQLSKVKSRPLGQVLWANPWGLPGGMYPVGIDWDINGIPFWDFCTSNFQGALKIIITAKLFIVMTISPGWSRRNNSNNKENAHYVLKDGNNIHGTKVSKTTLSGFEPAKEFTFRSVVHWASDPKPATASSESTANVCNLYDTIISCIYTRKLATSVKVSVVVFHMKLIRSFLGHETFMAKKWPSRNISWVYLLST